MTQIFKNITIVHAYNLVVRHRYFINIINNIDGIPITNIY